VLRNAYVERDNSCGPYRERRVLNSSSGVADSPRDWFVRSRREKRNGVLEVGTDPVVLVSSVFF